MADSPNSTEPEFSSNVVESKLNENSNQAWSNVKITNSSERTYRQRCNNLLKPGFCKLTSIFGDISISPSNRNYTYTIDRVILATKSNYFYEHLTQHDEKDIADKISHKMKNGSSNETVKIIYGADLQQMISEHNFSQLFAVMNQLEMEIDLKIFMDFIDKNIKPKSELNHHMFDLYDILSNNDRKFDCLLPLVSSYFSDRLLEIYRKKEFLSTSAKGFVQILMNKSDNSTEKGFVGRICASWICHDFQIRINHMKNLVNVAKYRYEVVPRYYNGNWNSDLIKSSQVQEVEKYFNELFTCYGEITFDSPQILKNDLGCLEPRVVYSIDQVTRWMEILEKSLFCDVAINVQGTIFKLHRVKLYLASEYFRNLFTNQDELSNLPTEDESFSVISIPKEYSIEQIDPVTFQSVIHYIYTQEIEVTSETHLINLIKCSKFLEMDDLFANCSSIMLEIAKNDRVYDIFEVFQCAYETARYSELYDVLVEKIRTAWTTLDENRYLKTISLDILKEILAIPLNPYKIVAFCSKWIFHDIENRYHHTTEIARAINRNYTLDSDQSKLKVPTNSTDYTLQFVKEQLDSILSSTALVSINKDYFENESETPRFLSLNEDGIFSVLNGNFDETIQLARIGNGISRCSATLIEDALFILFNVSDKFHFQSYSFASKKIISLATHAKMSETQDYVILTCNNEVYYCDKYNMLRYFPKLNRWQLWWRFKGESASLTKYTSDGKTIYKIISSNRANKVKFSDFKQNKWISMPDIIADDIHSGEKYNYENTPTKVNIINHELGVLFPSKTYTFNWITQTWKSISNSNHNFVEFIRREKSIVYISDDNEVYTYAPDLNEWKLERKLCNLGSIVVIHTIEK